MKAADVAAHVVPRLIERIQAGTGDWSMPWRHTGNAWPVNAATGNTYQGGNVIALWLAAAEHSWPARWATYKQWESIGAQVRKGEHATWGLYWQVREADMILDTDPTTGETIELQTAPRFMWAKAFAVFNTAQVDGDTAGESVTAGEPLARNADAEAVFAAVPASVRWGAGRACYVPTLDEVRMPAFDAFITADHAYATLSHELAHWTAPRLGRTFGKRFGDHAYAAEELVAELSAAFTCASIGIDTVERCDHAAYIAHWCEMLAADPSSLWTVAGKAQAATEHLLAYIAQSQASLLP